MISFEDMEAHLVLQLLFELDSFHLPVCQRATSDLEAPIKIPETLFLYQYMAKHKFISLRRTQLQ